MDKNDTFSWSAADNTAQDRGTKWYIAWILIIVALAGASFAANFFLGIWQIWSSVGLAIVIFISMLVVDKNPGKAVKYELTDTTVSINGKSYPLSDFQSFTVADNHSSQTISLIPTKRVAIPYDLVVPTKDADAVVDILGAALPLSQAGFNFTDRISSVLKF